MSSTIKIRERDVEQYLVTILGEIGLKCIKFDPSNMIGMPDRIVPLRGGKVIWVELKKPSGGRLSEIQKLRHSELKKIGHDVRVIWSKEDADNLVEEIIKEQMC